MSVVRLLGDIVAELQTETEVDPNHVDQWKRSFKEAYVVTVDDLKRLVSNKPDIWKQWPIPDGIKGRLEDAVGFHQVRHEPTEPRSSGGPIIRASQSSKKLMGDEVQTTYFL